MRDGDEIAILFIGNSYTYCNNLPGMVEQLFRTGGVEVRRTQVTPGGWSLKRHWDGEGPDTQKVLREGRWDVVVLQDFSVQSVVDPDALAEYGRRFAELARQGGAEPVFYMTWARQHVPEMQAGIAREYVKLGRACAARVAPAGLAWQAALEQRPDLTLHVEDRSHPTPAGSYLAACVLYATISGRSPIGMPARIVAADQEGKEQVAADLDPGDAQFLQEAAWQTVQANASSQPLAPD